MKIPFPESYPARSYEGPAYADRVGGHLTFRDWEHWLAKDKMEYREEYEQHMFDQLPIPLK